MVGGHSASAIVGGVGGRKLKFKMGNAIFSFSIIGRRPALHMDWTRDEVLVVLLLLFPYSAALSLVHVINWRGWVDSKTANGQKLRNSS